MYPVDAVTWSAPSDAEQFAFTVFVKNRDLFAKVIENGVNDQFARVAQRLRPSGLLEST
jgi:hypothetical protein